jgi:osomolarity two-component system response regulator SSK1
MVQDAVVIDIPLSSKFGFAWPNEPYLPVQPPSSERAVSLSSSEEESDSEGESLSPVGQHGTEDRAGDHIPPMMAPVLPHHPRFSRAFSMPLPSQLNHLQNPMRGGTLSLIKQQSHEFSPFRELSLELADSVQMMIQTLLQITPAQVLDPAKEQFSACSLSVPTSSVSAMFTSMKNLNYISANMAAFYSEQQTGDNPLHPPQERFHTTNNEFDIGEMLQSVGDVLSGAATQAGVDLVLFHGDVGMKHVSVWGDENGISFALSHVSTEFLCSIQSDM